MIGAPTARSLPRIDGASFMRSLVDAGDLTDVDARLAQEVGRQNGQSVVRAVVELGLLSEEVIADRLSAVCECQRWTRDEEAPTLSDAAPREFMRANSVLLIELEPTEGDDHAPTLLVTSDPSERDVMRSIAGLLTGPLQCAIGTHKDIQSVLTDTDRAEHDARPGDGAEDAIDVAAEVSQLRDMASEAPVIRFFNQTIERAMELGASDVHLERFDKRVSLRMRVDGMLIDQPAPPLRQYEALLCRLKIMSELDIAERRRAQDGRIRMRLRGRMVDLRVSLVPTLYGQDAVLRLQDRQKLGEIDLTSLGFDTGQVDWLLRTAGRSHGILLITGPTGSGKTTTLYAMLRRLVNHERKIITVEDPVEYAMDGVNQIQVNPSIGLTFSGTLRNVLRHDPDVVLIGEIRDAETAEMAFQAALTGHMVLSTLHTNDVPGTFVRLIDMGVEPYLVNAVVEGVTAQRLIRKTCSTCHNDAKQRESCPICKGLGYKGRIALMEYSGLPSSVKRAIVDGSDERRLRELLLASDYKTMRERAADLIAEGLTDDAEVCRVLGHPDAIEGEA